MPGISYSQVICSLGNYSAVPGQQISVPIRVNNFTNLGSMSLTILFDPNVLTYNGNSYWDPSLTGTYFSNGITGKFILSWYAMAPHTIADTAIVGTMDFTYNTGTTAIVFDIWTPAACEISDELGVTLPTTYINGSVTGGGPTPACSNSFSIATGPTLSITVFATAVNASPIYNYMWDFGDGTTSAGAQLGAYHTYATLGTYTITLTTFGFNLCVATSSSTLTLTSCNVFGFVYAHNNLCLEIGMIEFYEYDTITSNYNFYDSLTFSNNYFLAGFTQGGYLLKVTPGDSSYSILNCVPTYSGDTPFWDCGTTIHPCGTLGPYHIHMAQIVGTTPGPGNIGGTINMLLKQTNSGVPAEGVEILLTTLSDSILAIDYSDNTGGFHFNNLAYGTYKLRAEITTVHCTPIIITLSPSNPSDTNIIFNITPGGIILGLPDNTADLPFTIVRVFPNPANDRLSIEVNGVNQTNFRTEIYNLIGQMVISQDNIFENGSKLVSLNTESLKTGSYFLSLKTADGHALRRNLIICR